MNNKELPQGWKIKLEEYLKEKGSKYKSLSASDFDSDKKVKIEFEDGSYAEFNSPLIIEAPEYEENGVFTEHCGYFYFNKESIKYKLISES